MVTAAVVMLNTDGTLYTTFDGDGKLSASYAPGYERYYTLAIDSSDRLVCGGEANYRESYSDMMLSRYPLSF